MTGRRSRRDLIVTAGAAWFLAACGGTDPEPPGGRDDVRPAAADLALLRFTLRFEYLTTDFYERLAAEKGLEPADSEVVSELRDDEEQHAEALEALVKDLGGAPPARPRLDFEAFLSGGPEAILARAAEIENLGAALYLGQVPRVQDDDVLVTLLSIHSVEGRHAAALNRRVGRSIVPDGALARPVAAEQARARVAGYER